MMEQNKVEDMQKSKANSTDVQNKRDGRRKFLRRASTAAVIASIPAKSVWATGMTNSMVASGHGSDMAGGNSIHLVKPHKWVKYANNHQLDSGFLDQKFSMLFGGAPIKNGSHELFDDWLTVRQVLTTKKQDGKFKYAGPNNLNRLMISTVLSAKYSGHFQAFYPVVGYKKPFPDVTTFARKVYGMTPSSNAGSLANQLRTLHENPASLRRI
jgi:hypothetical protein